MFGLKFQDKDLNELTLEETIEFEKLVLKRVLAANTAMMSDEIINQLNNYLSVIREHKQEKIGEFRHSSIKTGKSDSGSLDIGEDQPEPTDNTDGTGSDNQLAE
jgi:hypothetical protein